MSNHRSYRKLARFTARLLIRCRNRPCLRGRRSGPDDLSQALTALGRALRAHRRLAKLAPSFFDTAVRDREAENRAEQRRWLASWEPALAKAYGVAPRPLDAADELPPLPSPRIQRAVDRKLVEREMWLAAGDVALERYRRRQPHALMSWRRMARLLLLSFDFKKLALGLDSPNRVPDKLVYDYELTDLKRGYGHLLETTSVNTDLATSVGRTGTSLPAAVVGANGLEPHNSDTHAPMSECQAEVRPLRCDAWSRWARTLRQMKS